MSPGGSPPGHGLRRVAGFIVGSALTARVFDPLIADLQAEWCAARSRDDAWRIRLRWTLRFVSALALTAPRALATPPRSTALTALALGAVGVAAVGAADIQPHLPRLHALFLALGTVAMLALATAPRRWWTLPSPWVWAFAGALGLAAPHLHRLPGSEASRWIAVGALRVQPGELCKVLLVLALAGWLTPRPGVAPRSAWGAVGLGALFVLPALSQPDVGLALVMVAMVAGAVSAAGGRHAGAALGGCALGAGGLLLALRPAWGCWSMPGALLANAAARGGLAGSLGGDLAPVTTRHTDFVLAVMAQRAGLLGLALVFGIVALVVHEARVTARRSGEPSARVAASAVAAGLVAQTALHVAGVAGVLPLTGVALPGVSFGGSALVALLASVGLVVGLARTPPAQASPCETREPAP